MYTDNPAIDFAYWDAEQVKAEALLPVCDDCGEAINDDYYYEVDGDILCEECMRHRYRRFTEDYIEN